MERIILETRDSILASWVSTAAWAYKDAATLLGMDVERSHVVQAMEGYVSTELLRPSYMALARRYQSEVNHGMQPDVFVDDHEGKFRQDWVAFALNYLRREGRAQALRWVLQASIGLGNGVSPSSAANLLLGYILDSPLSRPVV